MQSDNVRFIGLQKIAANGLKGVRFNLGVFKVRNRSVNFKKLLRRVRSD